MLTSIFFPNAISEEFAEWLLMSSTRFSLECSRSKYTDPAGRGDKIIANTGKSGLTLIKARPPYALAPSTAQQKYIRELEADQ